MDRADAPGLSSLRSAELGQTAAQTAVWASSTSAEISGESRQHADKVEKTCETANLVGSDGQQQ